MNELVETLLRPVSADQPCGPDLENDPRFEKLATILKGKPEVEIGSVQKPAEPPDWRELKDGSAEFLGQSKHLRVAVMLSCSLLKTTGLEGFRDGLQLIRGLLEQYWPTVYPLLDPEDKNDPTQRLNILSALTAPRGSITGWLTIVDYLYAVPVSQPKGAAPVTFDQLLAGKGKPADGEAGAVPGLVKVAAAIRAPGDQVATHHQALQEALESARGIDQFLTNTLGARNAISFEVLDKTLQSMAASLEPYLAGAAVESDMAASAEGADSGSAGGAATFKIMGSIRSREDVVRAIDAICDYYRQVEPSSPMPYLLRRAQKVATMNFVQSMQELNLASADALRPSMGTAVDSDPLAG